VSRKLLIKNGLVVCPSQNIEEKLDLLIIDDKIAEIKKEIKNSNIETLDAKGKIVTPGLVDMHCHLREPGREDVATIQSGSKSAAAGGYTSIVCMANTNPILDSRMGIEYIYFKGKDVGLINIYPIGAVTTGLEGKELCEIATLVEAGAVAISDDENSITDSSLMRRALEYITMFKIPLITHCEDRYLSDAGCINEGLISTRLGFIGNPSIAEEIMVSRDIILTKFTQSKLHIAHVTTKGSVDLIRQAKKNGVNITCEVTPHHLSLKDSDLLSSNYDTNLKVSPPLRGDEDLKAITEGLKDGTIDVIATDHSPWLDMEKDVEFINAPYGIIGFETAIPIIFEQLINTKQLSIKEAIAKLTCNPAKILNIPKGSLAIGSVADITIIDPNLKLTITEDFLHSITKNTPFIGKNLKGFAVYTIVDGCIVYDRAKNSFFKKNL